MASAAAEILRQQLREKFPQAHGLRAEPNVPAPEQKPFHVDTFPVGAISKVVPAGPVAGILLLVAGLLGEPDEVSPQPEMVLIDGTDGFDPDSFEDGACSKLLWVRCRSALEMAKAADLLIHDGNLPFTLPDATGLTDGRTRAQPFTSPTLHRSLTSIRSTPGDRMISINDVREQSRSRLQNRKDLTSSSFPTMHGSCDTLAERERPTKE
jgi:hypothetical protein